MLSRREGVSKVPSPSGGGLGWGRPLRVIRNDIYHHSLLIAGEMGFGNTLLDYPRNSQILEILIQTIPCNRPAAKTVFSTCVGNPCRGAQPCALAPGSGTILSCADTGARLCAPTRRGQADKSRPIPTHLVSTTKTSELTLCVIMMQNRREYHKFPRRSAPVAGMWTGGEPRC